MAAEKKGGQINIELICPAESELSFYTTFNLFMYVNSSLVNTLQLKVHLPMETISA